MKSKSLFSLLGIVLIFLTSPVFAANSPTGYWKTVDDKTGQVLSVVEIYQAGNTLEGKIVKIMPVLGQRPTDICVKCKGPMHNRPMMGLKVMWGMSQISPDTWGRGQVLDPKSGNIYRGNMRLTNNGNDLHLRGYVGLPMFGRSETWVRTNNIP